MPEKEIGRPGGRVGKRSVCDQAAQRGERFVKRGMRHLGTWIAIPAAIRPLPGREPGSQFGNARIGAKAEPATDQQRVPFLRGVHPTTAGNLGDRPFGIEQPVEHLVDRPNRGGIGPRNAQLNQAQQAPMRTLPFLVGMARMLAT